MFNPAMRVVLTVLVILVFISASGCVHKYLRVYNTPESIQKSIRPGNMVAVITTDRRKLKFKVTAIDSQSISSNNERIFFSDIKKIYKKGRKSLLGVIPFILPHP